MSYLFRAKTDEAHYIKILSELLQSNIKTALFTIDHGGIKLRMFDDQRPPRILIDIFLDSTKFTSYKLKLGPKQDTLTVGISLTYFHKLLKSTKKNDSLLLFIDQKNPNELGISILPKDSNRKTTSTIKIQNLQCLDIDLPGEDILKYDHSINIPSKDFQKMCKDISIGKIVKISAKKFNLSFETDTNGIYQRKSCFGDDEDEEEENKVLYTDEFDIDRLSRITKMAGLNTKLQIYPKEGLPLRFSSLISNLGSINIYIKSRSQLENERKEGGESDDDD